MWEDCGKVVVERGAVSLRSMLIAVTVVVAVLAAVVLAALVSLTTILARTTGAASSAAESVWIAEEMEVDLLLHDRSADPILKRELEQDIRDRVVAALGHVSTAGQQRAVAEAELRLDGYFAATRDPLLGPAEIASRHQSAYDALEALVAINVIEARGAQAMAARLEQLGNGIGLALGVIVIATLGAIVIWLQRRAFAPVLSLAHAMQRFARGDRDSRAEERGPAELQEMGRRFNEMAEALVARRHAQIAFLGGVAHDLRNPLNVLQMSVQLVRPGVPLPDEDVLRQMAARAERQVARMQRMVDDFLDMTKIEAGELQLQIDHVDLRDVVRDVIELFDAPAIGERLTVALPAEPAVVRGDQLRLEQVLTNLISNAIKYSPPGAPVEVAIEHGEGGYILRVTDRGTGVAERDQPRMFEPFRRVGSSRETAPGVGLGLFVVKRIVEAHGGTIRVDSSLGLGSTFRVVLPEARATVVSAAHARASLH